MPPRGKKRQNIVRECDREPPVGATGEPMGRRRGDPLPLFGQWRTPGRSLELRSAFRPQRKPFRLQSFTDKPAGWSIIITFRTRDPVLYANRPRRLSNR